jgi:hypothetical protein
LSSACERLAVCSSAPRTLPREISSNYGDVEVAGSALMPAHTTATIRD